MRCRSKKEEKKREEAARTSYLSIIVEIPEDRADEDNEVLAECAGCGKEYKENAYVVDAKCRLRLDNQCISCDPASEGMDWCAFVPLV